MSEPPTARTAGVVVHAPGRLHLGFLDPSATLGRAFGSLGLVIEGFETVVEISEATPEAMGDTVVSAGSIGPCLSIAEVARAHAHLETLRERTGCRAPVHLRLLRTLPAHAGFGSGTQLALAIGRAFMRLHRLTADGATLAAWLGRGRRSGVGIAGFEQGGLLLDGGPSADGQPAPVISRLAFPEAWRVLVVQDGRQQGLSGSREKQAIGALRPMPQSVAAEICHQVLMRVLPGVASADFPAFAAGLTRMQELLGEHFAPAQGGGGFTSEAVGQLVQWIDEAARGRAGGAAEALHGAAVGQSSWGPTGFAILPSAAAAESAMQAVRAAGLLKPGMSIQAGSARNGGATVTSLMPCGSR